MKLKLLTYFIISILVAGCSDSSTTGSSVGGSSENGSSESAVESGLALNIAGGNQISSESLICNYRQEFGSNTNLSLNLQYLSSPNAVAFAVYIENPIPSAPYVVSAGQQGKLTFEVFNDNAGFSDSLTGGEIEVSVDDLPSPSTLTDGDLVSLNGNILVNTFTLPKTSAAGDLDVLGLVLEASNIKINCEAEFQMSEVVI